MATLGADRSFTEAAVTLGLVSPADASAALAEAAAAAVPTTAAEVLQRRGLLQPDQAQRALEHARAVPTVQRGPTPSSGAAVTVAEPFPARSAAPLVPGPPGAPLAYEVLEEIGRGGMGVVYRARHLALDRVVALKVLGGEVAGSPEAVERFRREANVAARLQHPGIVAVHDFGDLGGRPCIAMEYVDGLPLDRHLERARPDLRTRADLVRRAAEAVEHAHALGIVHRDLKPANILVDRTGAPRVTDFGLAREISTAPGLTRTGVILGTPEYMSPEQADGDVRSLDARSDVFSLGVTLYEVLTGRRPFEAEGTAALVLKIVLSDPVAPRRLDPAIPPDLETICLAAMSKDRSARYASAGVLAADLGRFLAGEPIRARPVSTVRRLYLRVRRHRRVVLPLALAGLVLAGATAWLGLAQWRRSVEAADLRTMARVFRALGEVEAARDAFQRALALDGGEEESRAGLAWADAELARRRSEQEAERRRAEQAEAAARETLRKAGLVSKVLVRWGGLVEPLRGLEAILYDDRLTPEGRGEAMRPLWAAVERFCAETPPDLTSQATMLALAGWASCLAGRKEEGLAGMGRAVGLDADVPFGRLMRALVLFARYDEIQPLPEINSGSGPEFGRAPGESVEGRGLREEIEALLAQAERSPLWGREAADDLRAALGAVRAWQRGEYAAAEAALTRALASDGLRAFATGLRLARGKMRYLQKKFAESRQDLDEVIAHRSGDSKTRHYLALVDLGEADEAMRKGADPRPAFERTFAAFEAALRLTPESPHVYGARGAAFQKLSQFEEEAGGDPRANLRRAIEDYGRGLAGRADPAGLLNNRGAAYEALGSAEARLGGDAREAWTRGLEDCTRSIELAPESGLAYMNRGLVCWELGKLERAAGRDSGSWFERAIADFGEALRRTPEDAGPLVNRGLVHWSRAEGAEAGGPDAKEHLRRAAADFDAALARQPGLWQAHANKGMVLGALGEHAKAVAEFEAALALCPGQPQLAALLEQAKARAAGGGSERR